MHTPLLMSPKHMTLLRPYSSQEPFYPCPHYTRLSIRFECKKADFVRVKWSVDVGIACVSMFVCE